MHRIVTSLWQSALAALLFSCLFILPASPLVAQGKGGKGGGGGGSEPPPAVQLRYAWIQLDPLDARLSAAWGINNHGQVVGHKRWDRRIIVKRNGVIERDAGGNLVHVLDLQGAFFAEPFVVEGEAAWSMVDPLVALSAERKQKWLRLVDARAINDNGEVIGQGTRRFPLKDKLVEELTEEDRSLLESEEWDPDDEYLIFDHDNFEYRGGTYRYFVDDGTIVEDLDFANGGVAALNSHGETTGGPLGGHAFHHDGEGFAAMFRLRSNDTWARGTAINDSGQIAGYSGINPGTQWEAFLYTPTSNGSYVLQGLGGLRKGDYRSYAFGISSSGEVVGDASTKANGGSPHAFLYRNGRMEDLGTLGGGSSRASAVRAFVDGDGKRVVEVVGRSQVANGTEQMFLYRDGIGMVNLENAVENLPPGYSRPLMSGSTDGLYINEQGWIAGQTTIDGVSRAAVLIPLQP